MFPNLLYQEIDIGVNDTLLLLQCLCGKCIREEPPHSAVLHWIAGGYNASGLSVGVVKVGLEKRLATADMPVDIFPGSSTIEGDHVRA